MDYYLSLYTQHPLTYPLTNLTQEEPCARVTGAWRGETAGGCANHATWVKNPQFSLQLTQHGPVTVTLTQEGRAGKPTHVGMLLWKTTDAMRCLTLDALEGKTQIIDAGQLSLVVEGPGTFNVMPMTFNPGDEMSFELAAVCPTATLVPVTEWTLTTFDGQWTTGKCGGCCNEKTWKENPTYTLTVSRPTKMTIILATADGTKKPMGFYIFNPTLTTKIENSKFVNGDSVSGTFNIPAGTYAFLPTTFNANLQGPFKVSIYSDAPLSIA